MYYQQFKCTTQEPLILFKKAKTEQSTETLEFIPGSLFRGVVANKLFNDSAATDEQIDDIIFNGNVWFGDAHLIIKGQRSKPIPFSIHKYQKTPKGELPFINLSLETPLKLKHKQVREGYYIEKNGKFLYQSPGRSERMKAARSLEHRASEESGMYLYRYIEAGQSFEFFVHTKEEKLPKNEDSVLTKIAECFSQNLYLGKSKSSEFGGKIKVEAIGDIERFEEEAGNVQVKTLFAASNWCFLNEYGTYTSHITAEMVCGNADAKIDWNKTFLRFRTYAPFNSHRNAYDAQRLIIEKGSVITLENPVMVSKKFLQDRIGVHKTEGFGEVLHDIDILEKGSIAIEKHDPKELEKKESESLIEKGDLNDPFLLSLAHRKEAKKQLIADYNNVEELVEENKNAKKLDKIKDSQWGNILRKCKDKISIEEIETLLFVNDQTKLDKNKTTTKWNEQDLKDLKSVLKKCKTPQAFKIFLKQKINERKDA